MRLRIESLGATARHARIWIDDVERSADVVSVNLSLGVNQVTHATIEFILRDGVDLDLDAQSDGLESVRSNDLDDPGTGEDLQRPPTQTHSPAGEEVVVGVESTEDHAPIVPGPKTARIDGWVAGGDHG